MNIYVSKLNFNTNSASLQQLFANYGTVTSANVIIDKYTGMPRGFGFVEMSNDEEGQNAINELNNTNFEGNNIVVNVARPREDRSNNGGGYNRNRY